MGLEPIRPIQPIPDNRFPEKRAPEQQKLPEDEKPVSEKPEEESTTPKKPGEPGSTIDITV